MERRLNGDTHRRAVGCDAVTVGRQSTRVDAANAVLDPLNGGPGHCAGLDFERVTHSEAIAGAAVDAVAVVVSAVAWIAFRIFHARCPIVVLRQFDGLVVTRIPRSRQRILDLTAAAKLEVEAPLRDGH